MNLKFNFLLILVLLVNLVNAQDYLIQINLSEVRIVDECHFGNEWSASFSFGGEYRYRTRGDTFLLKPKQSFPLKSIIEEGSETYDDYESIISTISHDSLSVGVFSFKQYLYVEDENKGRYECNNATFKFDYTIRVFNRYKD